MPASSLFPASPLEPKESAGSGWVTDASVANARATFECRFDCEGEHAAFLVMAGIEALVDHLDAAGRPADHWVTGLFGHNVAKSLGAQPFLCDLHSAPEGTVVFPGEPVLVIEGPFWQAQSIEPLVRAALEGAVRLSTLMARCAIAAAGAEVIDDRSRYAGGIGGSLPLARAAHVGGAHGTTWPLASEHYGIPLARLQPTGFVAAYPAEQEAFAAWVDAAEASTVLRLDTCDLGPAIDHAVSVVKRLRVERSWGAPRVALELGHGDYVGAAKAVARAFERAGLPPPPLVLSGLHTEAAIADLQSRKLPVYAFVIDTAFSPAPGIHFRYDLTAIEEDSQWAPRVRVGKTRNTCSDPGRKAVFRYTGADGTYLADVAYSTGERLPEPSDVTFIDDTTALPVRLTEAVTSTPLLENVMRTGRRIATGVGIGGSRERARWSLAAVPERHRRLVRPAPYPRGSSDALHGLKTELLSGS